MNIDLEKDIVQSLSSLYPLQEFEEKAIDTVLNAIPYWIPVTDGLPNIREDVLVSYYDEVMVGWLNDDSIWFAEGFGRLNMNDIVAWMPLPKPYKEYQYEQLDK